MPIWQAPAARSFCIRGRTLARCILLPALVAALSGGCEWLDRGGEGTPADGVALPYGCAGQVATTPYLEGAATTPSRSMARYWNEAMLAAIRSDLPMPTVHARNLFHVSAAMYDAWAAYDEQADGYYYRQRHVPATPRDRDTAIAFAAYRVLEARYVRAAFPEVTLDGLRGGMTALGLDPCYVRTGDDTAAAIGNSVARAILDATLQDGSNEANDYADTTGWIPVNPPLVMADGGADMAEPDHFQLLLLEAIITQNGIPQDARLQDYIGPHWASVTPFALRRPSPGTPYFSPPALPAWNDPQMTDYLLEVIRLQASLDQDDPARLDISPASLGNSTLGTNDGTGHAFNPATGLPYEPQSVPAADYGRLIAEFWADGPRSETPPGHWNLIANRVSDRLADAPAPGGTGAPTDPLAWDVRLYFTLNGALHDAAIAAWEVKRAFTSARPVSLVRYRAALGQSSDPGLPGFHPDGLPLVDGLVELVTEASSAPGQRHAHLKAFRGEVAVRGWLGTPEARGEDANVGWLLGEFWVPYQLPTFVTPAFPAYVSGHSTFSRAAAEVLAAVTGTPYFPGGLFEYPFPAGSALAFEPGPVEPVTLQWATYFDAADQSGRSRMWGGIHIAPDDLEGRRIGHQVGTAAVAEAARWIDGTATAD